jgi:uncharacterized protein with PIN domain
MILHNLSRSHNWKVKCSCRNRAPDCHGQLGYASDEITMENVAKKHGWKRVNKTKWFCPACLRKTK